MNGNMDLSRLMPGFDDPELGSQQTFRAMVKALDNPGPPVQIKSSLSVPEDLNPASAALFLTLCNHGTTVWADLDWSTPLVEWFQYQCGCDVVTEPCMASLVLITAPISMPSLDKFRIGDNEHPDSSATLIVQVSKLPTKATVSPIGKVVNMMINRTLRGLTVNYRNQWNPPSNSFPLGIDIFLTCDDILAVMHHR